MVHFGLCINYSKVELHLTLHFGFLGPFWNSAYVYLCQWHMRYSSWLIPFCRCSLLYSFRLCLSWTRPMIVPKTWTTLPIVSFHSEWLVDLLLLTYVFLSPLLNIYWFSFWDGNKNPVLLEFPYLDVVITGMLCLVTRLTLILQWNLVGYKNFRLLY